MQNRKSKILDDKFMKRVIQIASRYKGQASPDPTVAAIIVKNGKIISEGFHNKHKSPHAESYAIAKAKDKAKGATLYVNLEPCCHWGNTPPCTENIIKSGIKRVVAAMKDPNPLVNGKGFKELLKAGIEVKVGVREKEAKDLNENFIKHISQKLPFVILKIAMSLDGKIATRTKQSKWISHEESQKYVHKLRSENDAVLIGKNTAIIDNPLLTARKVKTQKQPVKVIVDSKLSMPIDRKFINDKSSQTIIATTNLAKKEKIYQFEKKGCKIIIVPRKKNKVNLKKLLFILAKMNITSILVEGGSQIAGSLIDENLVDKIVFIISPKIIGGKNAIPSIAGNGAKSLKEATKVKNWRVKKSGEDIIIEGCVDKGDKK